MMDAKRIPETVLAEATRRLVAELHPEQVILFGSQAWGTPTEDSDVDLLVIVPESPLPLAERAAQARPRLRGLHVPIDLLVRTRAEVERYRHVYASLESEILERGRVLYG